MANRDDIALLAKTIRESLIGVWKQSQGFVDNDDYSDRGLLSEATGLTSLTLLNVALYSEKEYEYDKDREDIDKITHEALNYIYDQVMSNGFTAEPLVFASNSKTLFNKENSYVDALTWVLSSMVLVRYAQRNKILTLDKEYQNKVFELISKSLMEVIKSQNDDGMWGFTTDKGACGSLVYTYSVNSSIADFYDYILDEISEVVDSDSGDIVKSIDTELIEYINSTNKIDVVTTLNEIRKKSAKWMICTCLSYLPRLADCKNVSEDVAQKLGLWNQKSDIKGQYYESYNYMNLYYAYYIIDMMTVSYADAYFKEMAKGDITNMAKVFRETLPSDEEYRFFFGGGSVKAYLADPKSDSTDAVEYLYNNLYKGYVEQAIHAARNNFISASRTGNRFWDSEKSELILKWVHSDDDVNYDIDGILDTVTITDPALLPMALRVNTCYSYYISLEKDFSLKKLYDMVVSSISSETKNKCKKDLWDQTSFNLSITERSIEAIVDYYDYVCRFEGDVPIVQKTECVSVHEHTPSELDAALEKMIDERIAAYMSQIQLAPATAAHPISSDNETSISDYLHYINSRLDSTDDIVDTCDANSLEYVMLLIYQKLHAQMIRSSYRDTKTDRGIKVEEDIDARINTVTKRLKIFYSLMVDEAENADSDLEQIFLRKLKGGKR